ncbi:Metallothionein expression activator [Microsporum audouinii]
MLQNFSFPSESESSREACSPSKRHFTPRPIAPAPPSGRASHRRGLSLDQGVALHQQNTSIYGQEPYDWSRWLDIGDYNINLAPGIQRPMTPLQHTENGQSFPLTPATTPCWKPTTVPPRNCRTAQSSPTKRAPPPLLPRNGEPMQRAKSFQGSEDGYGVQQQSLQNIHMFQEPPKFQLPEDFESKLPKTDDDIFTDLTFETNNSDPFALGGLPSPTMTSFSSQPELPKESSDLANTRSKKVPIAPAPTHALPTRSRPATSSGSTSPIKAALAPRVVTIADLKLDASIDASLEETGVTLEDICGYIEGPDPVDNKWICTFDGCMKRFGRKENIKSHVQTHLGDRQFKCNHCNKSFVRGHDLKRHSKIHTGVKPYPCDCGNSFARHDALTRHKQRGMCSGAFVGAVRRAERRGRPRKERPKYEERREKATRARQRERKKAPSPPSQELSSSSSAPSPESENLDAPSTREHSPAKEMLFLDMGSISLPPDVFTFTPPASPSYSTGNIGSPARSYHSTSQEPEESQLCLSPSKRYLADIPEEPLEPLSLGCGSPTPVKRESKRDLTGSPCRTLWPTDSRSTFAEDSSSTEFDDVFSSHSHASTSAFDPDQLPLGPQSTTGLSESGSSQYDDDIFLNHLNGDGPNLDNDYFPLSLSPNTDSFFDSFTTELK